MKGYKVTNKDMQCRGFQFELNKIFKHKGGVMVCHAGFHFCEQAVDCFNYYQFDSENRVFEVQVSGQILTEGDKSCAENIELLRELTWHEVLSLVNTGKNNTGIRNSGYRNSGYSNSGNRNSGNWNSGDRNSGYSNSGNRNSGNRNSGNWNSGDRNSGDSNSGYRNSGAFCTEKNPILYLFDKPTKMTVLEWEQHKAVQLMNSIDFNIWVPAYMMSDEEKKQHPKYETTDGYLKTIPIKEAWANFWHNLSDENKKVFTKLPNFDWAIFTEITGITK